MNIPMNEKKEEALRRLRALAETFELGPELENYFREDKLYYSCGFYMNEIDNHPVYAELVKRFEREHNALVYHVIRTREDEGVMLSMLFVGDDEEKWNTEVLDEDDIIAFATYVDGGDYEYMGWIKMATPMGYLTRVL
ncbi:MAG: hypothetical protein J6A59_18025 [Lachnospiraceae bacterium]|nr:hypothetical protein [Lachnospiraceae bacterium]